MDFKLKNGRDLKAFRKRFNLTQQTLSDEIGYNTYWISHVETSNHPLSKRLIRRLEKYMADHTDTAREKWNDIYPFKNWRGDKNDVLSFMEAIKDVFDHAYDDTKLQDAYLQFLDYSLGILKEISDLYYNSDYSFNIEFNNRSQKIKNCAKTFLQIKTDSLKVYRLSSRRVADSH